MPCDPIVVDGRQVGIACSRGRRAERCSTPGCTGDSVALCDFPLAGAKAGKTCDRRMCARCRTSVGEDLDHCPAHARASSLPKGHAAAGSSGANGSAAPQLQRPTRHGQPGSPGQSDGASTARGPSGFLPPVTTSWGGC